ncbi:MAG TPA: adenylate/guanylate cyclase domain-containing protein, partial [Candidatus Binatia bacterium]|nr:adenylate/guanylate cyclase domain-containing protein [Candidatus Binatia bacterium]
MFCDLVGSTTLSGKLDPEDLREVVRAYQEAAAGVIQQYDGHIAQYLGDGLLVYFGYPQAHEHEAHRAIHTGLGIIEAMAALNRRLQSEHGVELAVRLGIHTGPVVVGQMGGGGRHEQLALGETPNIAARLEGLAAPNSVVISQVTARLVADTFMLETLAPQTLKGVSEPIEVWRVVRLREDDEQTESKMRTSAPFLVGRDEEVGLLRRRWQQSKEGVGQVVLISGEAGVGKSSLVSVIRAQVAEEGFPRITFRCSPYHTNSVLYPVIAHIQRLLQFDRDDSVETKIAKLERNLAPYALAVENVVPLFAALLSLPLPEGHYPALNMSPQQQRQQTLEALNAWLFAEAERQPLLVLWEDLQWADPTTLQLLGLVAAQVPTAALLSVLTFRPEFVLPWPTRSHMTPLALHRLERSQVEAFMTHLASGKHLPPEVVTHVVTRADGVPLYVEELTKALLESDL